MTTEEFKQYVIAEAKKLYQAEIIKESVENKLSLLKEDSVSMGFELDPETLKKVRQEMIRKAAGWDFSQPQQIVNEIDKSAMKAAKKDIEADLSKFTPLGKNRFEKDLDKKELEKAMSPEKNLAEKKGKAVNPWAICHASTGPEKDAKFERCVMDVKAKNKIKKESGVPEAKGNKP